MNLAAHWGPRIREARLARGMRQEELAAAIGVTQPTISDWEAGRWAPRDAVRPALAAALGVPVAELFAYPAVAS